jgi:hypothetical protein
MIKSGKKEDLVLRCHVIVERRKQRNCLEAASDSPLIYPVILKEATGCKWKKDLRGLPRFTFVKLYDYLVRKTSKYSSLDISSCGYKTLKAFQFQLSYGTQKRSKCSIS